MTWKAKSKTKTTPQQTEVVKISINMLPDGQIQSQLSIQPTQQGLKFATILLAQMCTGHLANKLLIDYTQKQPEIGMQLTQLIPPVVAELKKSNRPAIRPLELFK